MEFSMGLALTLDLAECSSSDPFRSKLDAFFIFTGGAMQGTRKQNLVPCIHTCPEP